MGKVFIVSSFTIDRIKGLGGLGIGIGGPPYYCTLALLHHGVDSVTVVGPATEVHEYFSRKVGIKVIRVGKSVPTFELRYLNGSGDREVRLVERGSRLSLSSDVLNLMRGR